jgi:capsular exopolysaccharide synthesis family protein
VIPPNTNDSDFPSNGQFSEGAATGLLVPARQTLPAEPLADWYDSKAQWPADAQQQQGISPIEFVRALRRRWLLTLSVATSLAIFTTAMTYLFVPATEKATAILHVLPATPGVIGDRNPKSISPVDRQTAQQNEVLNVKSQTVLQAATRLEGVKETTVYQENKIDPIRFLTEELRVGFFPNSDQMYIEMRGERSAELITIVNAVVAAYQTQFGNKDRTELEEKIKTMQSILKTKRDDLREARTNLNSHADSLGTANVEGAKMQQQMLWGELLKLQSQQSELEQQATAAAGRWQLAQTKLQDFKHRPVTDTMIDTALEKDPIYMEMKQRGIQLEQAYNLQKGPRNSASLNQLAQAYAQAQTQMKDYRRQAGQRVRKQIEEPAEMEVRFARSEAGILMQQAAEMKKKVEKETADLKVKTRASEDMAAEQDRVEHLQAYILEKSNLLDNWQIEMTAPKRIVVLQDAIKPEIPDTLYKWLLTAMVGMLTFVASVFTIGGSEYFKRRVGDVQDVSKQIGLNLVGTVPSLPKKPGAKVAGVSPAQFDAILSDSIDSIRTTLIHGAASGAHRSIMVTSAWDGEGKTTVASQLAASLARCGRRTLLVDADIRNPTLHHLFELPHDIGVCEILRGEVEPRDVIRETPAANLWLLSAGNCDHRAVQTLENDNLGIIVGQLKSEYDFVIVDTAPVLAFADPLLIGQHVDGAILSVRIDHSQRPKVEEAVNRMRTVGINIFGAVVNGTKPVTSRRATERNALIGTS